MTRGTPAGLITFLVVAFGIPWFGWLVVRNDNLSLWLFPLFASIGGFAAAFAEGGLAGLRTFSKRVFGVSRVGRYALAAVVVPPLLGLSYLAANGLPLSAQTLSLGSVLGLSLGAAIVTGPLAEEFGWRGYVQPALLRRFAPFWAALLVGLVWWAWHFALYRASVFAQPAAALHFLAYLETWSLFAVFLVQRARGSVWPAVALHWAANTHPDVLRALLPSVDGGMLPGGSKGWLYYFAAACLFTLVNHRFYFTRKPGNEMLSATANHSVRDLPSTPAA